MTLKLPALVLAFALALGLFATSSVSAASFDCNRARAADERAICADRTLNDKDVKVAQLYEIDGHLLAMGGRGVLEDGQVHWLKGRRQCGANKQCLNAEYDHRLAALQNVINEVYTHGPF